jgi:hypothetical protein
LFFDSDLEYLGYSGVRDPMAPRNSSSLVKEGSMIAGSDKEFYAQTSFGREREDFWRHLWGEAAQALAAADEIVVIGYSLPSSDKQARDLLLERDWRGSTVVICCGSRSSILAEQFRVFYRNVVTAPIPTFEGWLGC